MKFRSLIVSCSLVLALTSCAKDYTEECNSFCSKVETCGIPIMLEDCTSDCNIDMSEKADTACQTSFEALQSCFEDNTCADILDEENNACDTETTAWLASCSKFMD